MPLTSGARIGIYEVVVKLGEGGMGEVYRARDTRLDREVALKVLPQLFTSDPERLARFEREAKVLASLNHPNIAQVFGFEANAIAMELVEGPTLDEVIRDGGRGESPGSKDPGLRLEDTLPIVRQIALALEAAHDQGIVHRDLKPANIKVRDDGAVKVLDFGLAKAMAASDDPTASPTNSPTLTARSTQLGMILGTAAYMAPEQAKGRAVDRRADVWAFGAVFFEMLAGRRLFEGDDVSEVLASVLKSEPDWSVLPGDLPGPVRRLLRRCLEKEPKKRLRDISEGMLQLEEGLATGSTASVMMPASAAALVQPPRPLWRRAIPIAATAVVTALAMWGASRVMTPATAERPIIQFQHSVAAPFRLFVSLPMVDVAISPDGQMLAYTATDQLQPPRVHLRRLDQLDATPLRGGETGIGPFFSTDGKWVGYVDQTDQRQIKKVSVLGGPPTLVATMPAAVLGATFTEDGYVIAGTRGGALFRVPDGGGTPAAVSTVDDGTREAEHLWPSIVPGTSVVLFVVSSGLSTPLTGGQLAAIDTATGKIARLKVNGVRPVYSPSGHIVFAVADGSLRAVPFDARRMALTGDPVPVLDGVGAKPTGAANFALSRDGHLVYATSGQGAGTKRTLAWVDRQGRETPLAAKPRSYFYARVSPDGTRLSLDVRDEEQDIWIWDLARETMSRLTDKPGNDQYGLWTPNGKHLVLASSSMGSSIGRVELFMMRGDGIGEPQQLTDTAADKLVPFPNAITADGKQVIFRSGFGASSDLFVLTLGDPKGYKKLIATEHDELNATISPDGRFIAFQSNLSSRLEVYVRPFPNVDDGQWPVSTAGGMKPVWAPGGKELFYLSGDAKLMAVPVDTSKSLVLGKPKALFDVSKYYTSAAGRNYDIDPKGPRFIMIKEQAGPTEVNTAPLTVILNWTRQLQSRTK